ncbi:MAG: RIP metalloprotease RseP [Candidatus Moraniibacteriota bacterium]|nr:MAG: RIP metalloprotease RseP [Candidatus Moranbacteria bacterium]
MFTTILIFLIILGVLIFVHEMGHFFTAIRNGVVAHEFGFGFPPRAIGVVKNENGKWKIIYGNREYYGENTLYSLNIIPLGGFVRIKGENPLHEDDVKDFEKLSEADKEYVRMSEDPDSFAKQSGWVRFKILVAGVVMNFVLAWVLISIVLMFGAPEPNDELIDPSMIVANIGVQIVEVESGSPAEEIGLKVGDSVKKVCGGNSCVDIESADHLRDTIFAHQGEEIQVDVQRGKDILTVSGVPRTNVSEGQGALGISMMETVLVKYPWYEALWEGVMRVINLTAMILIAFGNIIVSLITGQGVGAEVAGPVGIAMMTEQMKDLGFVYLLQFAAILSVNLGIINILPIPALDGGRILFVFIEKIKGSPVNHKVEGMMHTVFFVVLIGFMLFITVRDVLKLF